MTSLREWRRIEAERDEARADADRLRADIEAIHKRDGTDTGYCVGDGFVWPCPTARVLAATDAPEDTP